MAITTSYSLTNVVRDLTAAFEAIKKNSPAVLQLFQTGKTARHYKHEWFNEVLEPVSDTLAADITASDTSITVSDGSKFSVGDIITIKDANYELMKITAISGSTLTVTRGYGSTTAAAHSSGAVVVRVSHPMTEGSDADPSSVALADVLFNYTQIFRKDVKISGTAIQMKLYETDDLVNKAVQQRLTDFYYDLNNAAIYGARVAGDASTPRTAGGLIWWLSQADAIKTDASGATLTATMLNDLVESIVKAGGKPNTIICGTKQARKISALIADGTTAYRMIPADSRNAGGYVQTFTSDLPMGIITDIVVDINVPDDKILLVDKSKLYLVPLQNRAVHDFDSTPKDADAIQRTILGEYTFEIRNPYNAHGMLYNLG